jgi:EAL domain-containing protein (putative c-di-GMP-specific phosphodiesterase class I)
MVQLASNFSRTLLAEGIETQQQLDQLSALGCQLGQGYLLCRPCDLKELPIELS